MTKYRQQILPRLAVVTALLVAVGGSASIWILWPRICLWNLSRLAGKLDRRVVRGRLVGFPYSAEPVSVHARDGSSYALRKFRASAGKLARDFADQEGREELHASGVFLMAAGHPRKAVAKLARATALAPGRADFWNDLAVGRLAVFNDADDAPQLIDALGAVDQALRIDPDMKEAVLNRAQILETMGLSIAATKAWARYSAMDSLSPWAREAEEHRRSLNAATGVEEWKSAIGNLRGAAVANDGTAVRHIVAAFPQDARANGETIFLQEWASAFLKGNDNAAATALQLVTMVGDGLYAANGETFLRDVVTAIQANHDRTALSTIAEAQERYVAARVTYADGQRNVSAALPLFQSAADGFRKTHNPMMEVADFYVACSVYDSNRAEDARKMLQRLEDVIPSSHIALRAFIQWEIGTVYSRKGMLNESLEAEVRSAKLFERLGEDGNANVTDGMAAGIQSVLGRRFDSCRMQLAILRRISRSGDPSDLQRTIDLIARTEAMSGEWANALSLMTLAIDDGQHLNPRVYVSSLIWHALAAHRLGVQGVEQQDLALAREAASHMADEAMRNRAQNDVVFGEAVTLRATQPHRSVKLLDRYIAEARRTNSLFFLAEALLERGRALSDTGNDGAAIRDLRDSLQLAQISGRSMQASQFRDAYFRTGDSASRELMDALIRRGANEEAFQIINSERSRAYGALDIVRPSDFHRAIVVQYTVLHDHLVIFVIANRGIRVERVNISEDQLDTAVNAFLTDLDRDFTETSTKLSGILLQPIGSELRRGGRVIFIPDGVIWRVPLAALPFPNSNQRLVESVEVIIAPSAAVAARPARTSGVPRALLAVGNPAIDRERFPELESLPGAEAEVRRIAAAYPKTTILTGRAATRSAVLGAIQGCDVVHFGTHSVLLPFDPARSHLLLAPEAGSSGILYLADVEGATLRSTRLVVLAGCDTATPPDVRRNVETLALAFVAAGASNVVGTLWKVDDKATGEFSRLLHAALCRGLEPSDALHAAQLAMRNSADPDVHRTSAWAGFQLYGGGE